MTLKWTWLDAPEAPNHSELRPGHSEYVVGKQHQWGDYPDIPCPAALLMEDGTITVYGHWARFTSDEGCGCCSGGRYDKIVAWAPLEIEPPVRE